MEVENFLTAPFQLVNVFLLLDHFIYVRPEGQPSYMAPECLREPSLVTLVSDVWSAGVILFNILVRGSASIPC